MLPGAILRPLGDDEMAEYRRPFAEPGEGRRPTLTWPRQISIDGDPADVTDIVNAYRDWPASSPVPKLFVTADPGAILIGPVGQRRRTFPPGRGDRERRALRAGGQPERDRVGAGRLVPQALILTRVPAIPTLVSVMIGGFGGGGSR